MKINNISAYNNKNYNITGNKKTDNNINFGQVVFDYKLSKIFTSPTLAEPYVAAIKKLQEIPINLKEILDYKNLSGLKKEIVDEIFGLMGEGEVLNHTVWLKPVFEYLNGSEKHPIRSGIKLFSTLPAWINDSYKPVRDGIKLEKKSQIGFIDKDKRVITDERPYYSGITEEASGYEIYPSGKITFSEDVGACLPTMDGIKDMLRLSLSRRIDDICEEFKYHDIKSLKDNTEKAKQEAFNYMQTLISENALAESSELSEAERLRLMSASYGILEDAEKKHNSVDYIIRRMLTRAGVNVSDSNVYAYRVKGERNIHSIFKRLLNKIKILPSLQKDLDESNFASAKNQCYDIFGAKVNAKSDEELERIYSELLESIKSGTIKPTQVINYHGKGIKPIFSYEQMHKMLMITEEKGLDTKFTNKEHNSKSGYTSVHIRAYIADEPVELQIRTKMVDTIAQYLHLSYDLFQGKDVLSSYTPGQQKVLKPVINELLKIKNNKELRTKYNQYTQKCYAAARGNISDFPTVEEFGLPQAVSIENMARISIFMGE